MFTPKKVPNTSKRVQEHTPYSSATPNSRIGLERKRLLGSSDDVIDAKLGETSHKLEDSCPNSAPSTPTASEDLSNGKSWIPYSIHEEELLLEQCNFEAKLLDIEVKNIQNMEEMKSAYSIERNSLMEQIETLRQKSEKEYEASKKREESMMKLVNDLKKQVEDAETSNRKLKQELLVREEEPDKYKDQIRQLERSIDDYIKKLKDCEVANRIKSFPDKLKERFMDVKDWKSLEDQIENLKFQNLTLKEELNKSVTECKLIDTNWKAAELKIAQLELDLDEFLEKEAVETIRDSHNVSVLEEEAKEEESVDLFEEDQSENELDLRNEPEPEREKDPKKQPKQTLCVSCNAKYTNFYRHRDKCKGFISDQKLRSIQKRDASTAGGDPAGGSSIITAVASTSTKFANTLQTSAKSAEPKGS